MTATLYVLLAVAMAAAVVLVIDFISYRRFLQSSRTTALKEAFINDYLIESHRASIASGMTAIFFSVSALISALTQAQWVEQTATIAVSTFLSVESYRSWKPRRSPVVRAPGWLLHRLAEWTCSPRTFTEVLEPCLSDMQHLHLTALREGRPRKAFWVQLRGYWRFWSHVAALIPISITRMLIVIWRAVT